MMWGSTARKKLKDIFASLRKTLRQVSPSRKHVDLERIYTYYDTYVTWVFAELRRKWVFTKRLFTRLQRRLAPRENAVNSKKRSAYLVVTRQVTIALNYFGKTYGYLT